MHTKNCLDLLFWNSYFLTLLVSVSLPLFVSCFAFLSSCFFWHYLILCLCISHLGANYEASTCFLFLLLFILIPHCNHAPFSSLNFPSTAPPLSHRSIGLSSMSPDGFLLFLSSTCPSLCLCFFQQCPEVRGTYYLCVDSLQPSQILISFSSLLLWGHAAEESKGLSVHRHRHTYMETQTLTFFAGTNRASKTYLIYILGYFYFYFVKPL